MINKNNKLQYEDINSNLYNKNDINGNIVYYLDKDFKNPFTGEIYVIFKNNIESEAEYKNGYKNGLEYIYYTNGNKEQINECRGNLTYGVSKEYNENGDIKTANIVYNNDYIKILEVKNNKVVNKILYKSEKEQEKLPEYLKSLMQLSDEELINYEFKTDNPNLDFK